MMNAPRVDGVISATVVDVDEGLDARGITDDDKHIDDDYKDYQVQPLSSRQREQGHLDLAGTDDGAERELPVLVSLTADEDRLIEWEWRRAHVHDYRDRERPGRSAGALSFRTSSTFCLYS